MFRSAFHHVCNFVVIIPEYHLPLYHLIPWYHDSLCSSLEAAVFIVLRNFESPGTFIILLITPFYILFFNIMNSRSPGKIPVRCVWKVIISSPFFPNALSFNPQVIKNPYSVIFPVFHCQHMKYFRYLYKFFSVWKLTHDDTIQQWGIINVSSYLKYKSV